MTFKFNTILCVCDGITEAQGNSCGYQCSTYSLSLCFCDTDILCVSMIGRLAVVLFFCEKRNLESLGRGKKHP